MSGCREDPAETAAREARVAATDQGGCAAHPGGEVIAYVYGAGKRDQRLFHPSEITIIRSCTREQTVTGGATAQPPATELNRHKRWHHDPIGGTAGLLLWAGQRLVGMVRDPDDAAWLATLANAELSRMDRRAAAEAVTPP